MIFLEPKWFILIVFLPIIVYLFYKWYKRKSLFFNFTNDLSKIFKYWKIKIIIKLFFFSIIFINFIAILANPNIKNITKDISKNWIDIVLVLDISSSMEAEDLKPNRILAAKKIISNFLDKLNNDRVWLVVFAWKPFISLPLTFDYNVVKEILKNISIKTINQNNIEMQWTAIWDALLMANNLFKNKNDKKTKREKIIILLTDWDANRWVDPILASKFLKNKWIKIYTIWIWSNKWWYISYKIWPFIKKIKVPKLKENTLKQIANITNWKFFRATDNTTLKNIFNTISKLTKTEIKIKENIEYKPMYTLYLYSLILVMLLYIFLKIKEI